MAETGKKIYISEYDGFGPWAYEITDADQIPRLFAPYVTADDGALLKLKMPRDIDPRDAAPDMDLYDYVIALYEDRLRVLQRQDSSVREQIINGQDFMGARLYRNMLKGACEIFSSDETFTFSFNAISLDLVWKLVDMAVRTLKKTDASGRAINTSALPVLPEEPDALRLVNLLDIVRMKWNNVKTGAHQKQKNLVHTGENVNKVASLLWKQLNPEAVHLYTGEELIVLENGFFPTPADLPDLGYTYSIIPLSHITGVKMEDSKEYRGLKDYTLFMGQNQITYHFDAENTGAEAFYNALKKL